MRSNSRDKTAAPAKPVRPLGRHRKRCLRRFLVVLGAVALLGVEGSVASPTLHGTLLERSLPSKALRGRLAFEVYVPPGYATSKLRYPVIYFLHGLPASP